MALTPCLMAMDAHQKEVVRHSLAFPISCFHDELDAIKVPWHWHEEFEYAIVINKALDFLVESTRVHLEPGEGIFINSQALHAVDDNSHDHGELHSAIFHPRLIGGADSVYWEKLVQPFVKDSSLRYLVLRPEVPWQAQVLECLNAAWKAVAEEVEDYENLTRYQLSRALGLLNRNCPGVSKPLSQQERMDAARIRGMLEFIQDHYWEDLTIDTIAKSVSVSTSVCLRCFRSSLSTTPIQYLKQLRLEKAADQLSNTRRPAREIALDCGFNDVSYFTKSFREAYGITPTEFRKGRNASFQLE